MIVYLYILYIKLEIFTILCCDLVLCIPIMVIHYSEWGYYRDINSRNCVLRNQNGPKSDCLTGYVNLQK